MKNPNGYGTVTRLSGNRRKPWVAKEGKSGRQKPIGYAATREEALMLLATYNAAPWDIDRSKITLQELFNLWREKKAPKMRLGSQRVLSSAIKHCARLYSTPYCQIKAYDMQDCIDNCGRGYATQGAIKTLWKHLDALALEMDIVGKQYSALLESESVPDTSRKVFSDDEVARLWAHKDLPWADSALFFLYTGFRISEALGMRIDAVDFEQQIMTGGVKTAAGKNRVVPIHSKILHIVEARAAASKSRYLFEYNGRRAHASEYYTVWADLMRSLGMQHVPHECRHTFRSRLDSAGANRVCIDRLMGHKSGSTGERVYTHKTLEELRQNIELITN